MDFPFFFFNFPLEISFYPTSHPTSSTGISQMETEGTQRNKTGFSKTSKKQIYPEQQQQLCISSAFLGPGFSQIYSRQVSTEISGITQINPPEENFSFFSSRRLSRLFVRVCCSSSLPQKFLHPTIPIPGHLFSPSCADLPPIEILAISSPFFRLSCHSRSEWCHWQCPMNLSESLPTSDIPWFKYLVSRK